MVQLSTVFVTLCATACALAGPVAARSTQCALDTVQYLFWLNTVEGVLQSSRDTIPGAEALAVVGILHDINLALTNAVANGNPVSQTGFITNIGPMFDEATNLLTASNSPALTPLGSAQDAANSIAADCD